MTDLFEILTQAPPEKTPPAEPPAADPPPKVEPPGDEAVGNTPDLAAQVAALAKRLDERDTREKADHDEKEKSERRSKRRGIFDTTLAAVRGERETAADRKRRQGRNLFRKR